MSKKKTQPASADPVAWRLLGFDDDVLPCPKDLGFEGDPYLTRDDYTRLYAIVARQYPALTIESWWQMKMSQREELMQAAYDAQPPTKPREPNHAMLIAEPIRAILENELMSREDKLNALSKYDNSFFLKSSDELGELLGCTGDNIRSMHWWKVTRTDYREKEGLERVTRGKRSSDAKR